MTDLEFTLAYLKAIQKTHHVYFEKNKINIMDCVCIWGSKIVNVRVIKKDLPAEIKYEIEEMFWKN